jgi:hypothetical protein
MGGTTTIEPTAARANALVAVGVFLPPGLTRSGDGSGFSLSAATTSATSGRSHVPGSAVAHRPWLGADGGDKRRSGGCGRAGGGPGQAVAAGSDRLVGDADRGR